MDAQAIDELVRSTRVSNATFFGTNFFCLPIDTACLAVICVQVANYASSSDGESLYTRALVTYAFLSAIVMTVLDFAWAYAIFIEGFATYHAAVATNRYYPFLLISGLLVLFVQGHYTYKTYRLWRGRWAIPIACVCMLFAVLGFIGTYWLAISLARLAWLNQTQAQDTNLRIGGLLEVAGVAIADLFITGSIATSLWRSRTGWKRTDGIIIKLLLLVAETQLPPTAFAVILAVQWAAQQNGILATAYFMLSAKVVTISLLYSLNSRVRFRANFGNSATLSTGDLPDSFQLTSRRNEGPARSVHVQIETYRQMDDTPPSATTPAQRGTAPPRRLSEDGDSTITKESHTKESPWLSPSTSHLVDLDYRKSAV